FRSPWRRVACCRLLPVSLRRIPLTGRSDSASMARPPILLAGGRVLARFLGAMLLGSLLVPNVLTATSAAAANCQFVLGFKILHDLIPHIMGDCLADEHHAPNGDALQETFGPTGAGGLLVWRKADNWTAYTDGYHSWVNGPNGVQERLNTERFP